MHVSSHSPAVSVLMTSFNYERYIGAAIESVLAQTLDDWELIIVDDCSTDASWDVIQGFRDARIKAYRQPANAGACAAYNRALALARGAVIACLDSDDMYLPEKLRRQTDFLRERPDIDVCGSFVTEIDGGGNPGSGEKPFEQWFNIALDLNDPASWIWQNHLCHSGAVIRAELHRRLGSFAEHITYTPDWQFWLRALAAGGHFHVMPEPLVAYRNHGGNITHNDPPAAFYEHLRTLAGILLPWLAATGRPDLIEEAIRILARRMANANAHSSITEVAAILLSGNAAPATVAAALEVLVKNAKADFERQAAERSLGMPLHVMKAQLSELADSAQWHAKQSQAWEKLANENEQSMRDLRAQVEEASGRASDAEARLRDVRGHWAVRVARKLTEMKNYEKKVPRISPMMPKMNIRALRFVAGLTIVLFSTVNLIHSRAPGIGPTITERMQIAGPPTADPSVAGLEMTVGRSGLTIVFPSCDMTLYKDRFFVHVYPERVFAGHPQEFTNRDFDAASEPKRRVGTSAEAKCAIDRSYGSAQAEEVVFGQFSMPEGRCCSILWSRDLLLQAN